MIDKGLASPCARELGQCVALERIRHELVEHTAE